MVYALKRGRTLTIGAVLIALPTKNNMKHEAAYLLQALPYAPPPRPSIIPE